MITALWFIAGLGTAYLMYGEKDKLPLLKVILVILFGGASFVVWILFNLGTEVDNWFKLFRPTKKAAESEKPKRKTK